MRPYQTPPAPASQMPLPSTEIALRALLPLSAVENDVEVSTLPATSMRATARKTVAAAVAATAAVPGGVA